MRILCTLAMLLALSISTFSQTTIFVETFEDDPDTDYTASTPFNDGSSDHWNRTDGSDISNTSGPYSGFSGSFFWAAEDTDDNGGNGDDEQTIDITGIDITDYENLQITGLFGAGNENGPGSSAYDATDYIKIQYSIDGGSYIDLFWFSYVDAGDSFNEPLAFDANLDGNGEGTILSTALTQFTGSLPAATTGTTMDIRVLVYMDSAGEEIAFDDITVLGVQSTMPVDLTAFDATLRNGKVALAWSTASEKNNAGFEVERSADGRAFESIGFERGEGNSYENIDYTFVDNSPLAGLSYYRLKQVDYDGMYDYSEIIAIQNVSGSITVTPSSTSTFVTVSTNTDAQGTVYLYNSVGMLMQTTTTTYGRAQLDLANVQSGIYFLQIEVDGQVYTEKVVRD